MLFNPFTLKKPLAFLFSLLLLCACAKPLEIADLRCEMLENPLGIDNTTPHFSWKVVPAKEAFYPASYQLLVATDPALLSEEKADLWNSGEVTSGESSWIQYDGEPLSANSLAYWKVRIWDEQKETSVWSSVGCFSVGLLDAQDWQAAYIGAGIAEGESQSPLFRKTFNYSGEADKVLLHVNSLGYHEVYVNGKKVGEDVLTPAVSQFDKRSLSNTYDVTSSLKKGENELVLWLSKGWYRNGLPGVIEGGPFVRAQMVSYKDGKWENTLKTDATWLTRESGYQTPSNWRPHQLGGEVVYAANVLPDLKSNSLNSVDWNQGVVAEIPTHAVSPQMTEGNRIKQTIHPVSIQALNDSTWFVDMGTNLTGWTEIAFPPLNPQQKIIISYCDFLNEDGSFRENNQIHDVYVASGKGKEVFKNKFNYHAFRYIRLTNLRESLKPTDISAHLIHTNYEGESSFECSDADLNAIHDMVHYTLRCISLGGYMVDCPHLERLGYGGDGNASTLAGQTMFNMSPLYMNWMQAWADCMREDGSMPHTAPNPYSAGGGPYWCGFIITASWQTYVNYGDDRLLKRFYPFMQQWLAYVEANTVDGLLKQWPNTDYRNWYLGDWATPEGIDQTDVRSVDLVNNCYVTQCYDTMAKIAALLGKEEDKLVYNEKSVTLKKHIHTEFYREEEKGYATGTQIDLVYPMLVGATPQELLSEVKQTLYAETEGRFKGHLATGLVGVPIITQWVTENSEAELMYSMLKKRAYPGYLYMIDNGATTTWEHWNGERSHVHNCYNGIGSWFYQALAGIHPDEENPGYRHILLKPQPVKGVEWVKAEKDTPYGGLSVAWNITDSQFVMDVTIPTGTTAAITLPVEAQRVTVNDDEVGSVTRVTIKSGTYKIVCDR